MKTGLNSAPFLGEAVGGEGAELESELRGGGQSSWLSEGIVGEAVL